MHIVILFICYKNVRLYIFYIARLRVRFSL